VRSVRDRLDLFVVPDQPDVNLAADLGEDE
jgi:hypothetical protein